MPRYRFPKDSERNCLVTIQSATNTVSTGRAVTVTYPTTVCKLWVNIEQLSGIEMNTGSTISPASTHRMYALFYPGLDATMRVVFGSRIFDISSVDNVCNERKWTVLECIEGIRHGS